MNSLYVYIRNSLELDLRLLRFAKWSMAKKMEFLVKKYWLIVKHNLFRIHFRLGESKIQLFGKNIYYESKLGLDIFQSMYFRLGNMLLSEDISNIKTVIDVGANVGMFTLMIDDLCDSPQIFSVEPAPKTYEALRLNTRKLNNVKLHQLAISSTTGKTELYFDEDTNLGATMVKNSNWKKFKVTSVTLDEFVTANKIKNIDLLKIDVEGLENEVLKRSDKTLAKTKYLLLEIRTTSQMYTYSEIVSRLYATDKYDFQLLAFRNYSGIGEGKIIIGDYLFENVNQ